MSDFETAEGLAKWLAEYPWRTTSSYLKGVFEARDAAIRRQVAEEVLGRAEIEMPTEAGWIRSSVTKAHFARLRSEYASQDKSMNTNQTETETSSAHDEEVARRAKVEVLAEVMREWESRDGGIMSNHTACYVRRVCEKHSIQPHEIEPRKVYMEADIKVELLPTTESCLICCGPFRWSAKGWLPGVFDAYSKHDAEAIAAHLRATGNMPGGGK